MNASDVVKAKQNQTLYQAYYAPTVFQSTVHTHIHKVSSIFAYLDGSQEVTIDSYASCTTTVLEYVCPPTFVSYEMAAAVNRGAYVCGGKTPSQMQWENINHQTVYAYSSVYSTFTTTSTISPSTFYITSTTVMGAPAPTIVPLIQLVQGTNFASACDLCTTNAGACCHNCAQ